MDSDSLGPADRVAPTWSEPLAQRISRPFGGRLGRHAQLGRQWFWTPLRVVLLFAVLVLAAAWLFKAPCQMTYDSSAGPQLDWRNNKQYTAMCYTDIIPRYGMGDLAPDDAFPYKTAWLEKPGTPQEKVRYMEYPVLTGVFQWINARAADGWATLAGLGLLPGGLTSVLYFNLTAFWLAAGWLVTIWALVLLCRRRVWDVAIAALSPLVLVHAFTNFDALATALGTAGLLAWSRRRPVLAGVLIGLGGAAKLYPLFFLGPLLVLAWRAGKVSEAMRAVLAAALAWLAVNVPVLVLYPDGWSEFFRLNNERPADPDSLYNALMYFTGWDGFDGVLQNGATPAVLNAVSLALFLLACAAIGWLALAAPTRPRLAQLCFLVVAAFLLTNKVWSPQYSLWLVPLAVLAIPRWRLLLAWMAVDAAVWAPRMYYYLGTANKGLPEGWFLGAVLIRDAVVVALCVLVVREILNPALDKVRATLAVRPERVHDALDDPCGGFLDGAKDRFVLPNPADLALRRRTG
ncbi:glycosyltransferase 87 family protein [Saccharopolyspora oryzae]|uniref:Glycosyltransferase 87 family protein n=1 Tax=Saccharopolyspora oryzae TaxID=2997343 RepID=A0ABT4VBD0_9PSEU|nr:glycosyltransferase 87 family protein [Saccharopolyspora oryzae]MDA3631143.1 glycosyltransferase 87 family protein [Saccharopolyspora oryzae]